MGRPLHKDIFGTPVTRSFTRTGGAGNENDPVLNQAGIVVEGYFGGVLATDYQLVKQRGKSTYVVLKTSTDEVKEEESIPGSITGTNLKVGKLVSGTPSTNGEIRIVGYTNQGQAANNGAVSIAKLTQRIATDFSGNRYKWYLENDSSTDYIVLTAV